MNINIRDACYNKYKEVKNSMRKLIGKGKNITAEN